MIAKKVKVLFGSDFPTIPYQVEHGNETVSIETKGISIAVLSDAHFIPFGAPLLALRQQQNRHVICITETAF